MTHFRQGSFYYRRKENGRYLQVMYSADTRLASINDVSEEVSMFTCMGEVNQEISSVEFSVALSKALELLGVNFKTIVL